MKPGDIARCSRCGTEAVAYRTGGPDRWKEGEAVMISWRGQRHHVTAEPTVDLCLFCHHGDQPRDPPTRRVAICDDLAVNGCVPIGFEWNTDADVEAAYQRWIAAGRPRLVFVEVHPAPAASTPPAPGPAQRASRGQLGLFG